MKFWKDPSSQPPNVFVASSSRGGAGVNAAASRGGTAGADTWRQRKERDARAAGADAGTMLAEDDGNMDVTATSCSPNWEYFSSDGSGQKLT